MSNHITEEQLRELARSLPANWQLAAANLYQAADTIKSLRLQLDAIVPKDHVRLPDGRTIRVLGTLPLTQDQLLVGNGARVWACSWGGPPSGSSIRIEVAGNHWDCPVPIEHTWSTREAAEAWHAIERNRATAKASKPPGPLSDDDRAQIRRNKTHLKHMIDRTIHAYQRAAIDAIRPYGDALKALDDIDPICIDLQSAEAFFLTRGLGTLTPMPPPPPPSRPAPANILINEATQRPVGT